MKIIIEITPSGTSQTKVQLQQGDTPIIIGIQLASATCIAAQAFVHAIGLPKHHEEKVEAIIVETYERDMKKLGSMGEDAKPIKE